MSGFDLLDTASQLSIFGYLLPHPLYNTADRTESKHIVSPADLLQIVSPSPPVHCMVPSIWIFHSRGLDIILPCGNAEWVKRRRLYYTSVTLFSFLWTLYI